MAGKLIKVKVVRNIIQKSLGLIGKQKPENILIKTRFGIHTFGLRFPIDVLILDDNNRIVKLCESLQPNKVFFWNIKYDTVIELPSEFINRSHLKINSKILLRYM